MRKRVCGALVAAGLKHDPSSELLKSGLDEAQAALSAPPMGQGPFAKPEVLARLMMDPRTRPLLQQPDFQVMLKDLQANQANMMKYMNNPNFMLVRTMGLITMH